MKNIFLSLFLSYFTPLGAVEKISPADSFQKVNAKEAVLFDVREESEIKAEGKAAPAGWLPKSSVDAKDAVFKKTVASLNKDKNVIFYCRSGKRSELVALEFEKLGYKTLNMGAFSDWKEAGLPVSGL
jgi:rhodanese-related sulfurtransferase